MGMKDPRISCEQPQDSGSAFMAGKARAGSKTPGTGVSRRSKVAATAALAALTMSMFGGVTAANANDGGSGGAGGGGTVDPGLGENDVGIGYYFNDKPSLGDDGRLVSPQGWGRESAKYILDKTKLDPSKYKYNELLNQSCDTALKEAVARGKKNNPDAKDVRARVVGVMWGIVKGYDDVENSWLRSSNYFRDTLEDWGKKGSGLGGLSDPDLDPSARDNILSLGEEGIVKAEKDSTTSTNEGKLISSVCIALNEFEPENPGYELKVETDQRGSQVKIAGTKDAVHDIIKASNSGGRDENVKAKVILNYDGPEGLKKASKDVTIKNNGDTRSPDFTPADFGWDSWPATHGKDKYFWFDVQVAKQGNMLKAVDTPDRDARERWQVEPLKPSKVITNGDDENLTDSDVLASGMFYNAKITAHTNGFDSSMTITDIIKEGDVFIGAVDKDDKSKVKVLGPDGKAVDSEITIERKDGQTIVSGTVKDLKTQGEYTLVVPTYMKPTGSDYNIPDDSKVCYTAKKDNCLNGDSKKTRKVTPKPDKVWVLDEEGALVAADPDHTNQVAADEKVFLKGDAVSAVVNDYIPAKLANNFDSYTIVDDWSDGLKFLTMPGAKVFFDGKDVTGEFDITVDTKAGITTAKAKDAFLKRTGKLEKPAEVKLVITGEFKKGYSTDGKVEKMLNKGSVEWNNEKKKTNDPPIFTWTPKPEKQVVGSGDQDGDHTYEDINGMWVLPGQKLEYTIQLDLNVPGNQARGIKSLGVRDNFDPQFTPDMKSVEVYDSRNHRPIAAKNYTLKLDEATNSFTLMFTEEFIKANTTVDSFGAVQWKDNATFMLRFSGTVKDDTKAGSKVKNQAFQIINGVETETEIPEVEIPPVEPDKEDLSTDNVDIDGKTVVQGDIIRYRLTLDAVPSSKLAYKVHKLGMIDDYDEEFLEIAEDAISVVGKTSGKDVTDKFNIQVKDGKFYVFAKQVDSTNNWGQTIKGDPQPEDLAAYAEAPIIQGETPIIDQALLEEDYYIIADAKVVKEEDGYVIKNQASQVFENKHYQTKIVSNPLKDIDPSKDVVIDESTKDQSINEQEVKLNSIFNYRLRSSEIPANRAYGVSDWSITDTFDTKHDSFTGIWAVYTDTDVYDGDKLVFKAGDLLTDSADHEGENYGPLFEANWDAQKGVFTAKATDEYMRIVNTREDLPQAFSVYTKMERIAPGEKIVNKIEETYNGVKRESNEVWTKTPENPGIDVEKYTLSEGMERGDRDEADQAYDLNGPADQAAGDVEKGSEAPKKDTESDSDEASVPAEGDSAMKKIADEAVKQAYKDAPLLSDALMSESDTRNEEQKMAEAEANGVQFAKLNDTEDVKKMSKDAKVPAATSAHEDVRIGFAVTNTGDVDLKDVKLTDTTHEGTTGEVVGIMCEIDVDTKAETKDKGEAQIGTPDAAEDETKATEKIRVSGDEIGLLKVGETVHCVGTLTGVEPGTVHADTAKATGKSIFTGKDVEDSDDWHAKLASTPEKPTSPAPEKPGVDKGPAKGAVTGEAVGENTGLMALLGTILAAMGLGGAATWLRRRHQARSVAQQIED